MIVTKDTACTRNPYKTVEKGSIASCCALCMADADCGGFTLHSHNGGDSGSCLFSHQSGIVDPRQKPGIACVTKQPIPPPGPSPPSPHPPSPPSPSPHPSPPSPSPSPPPPQADVYVAFLPIGTNLSIATIDELYEVGSSRNVRQWPARYPNGNPAKARDGYTGEGEGIAPKIAPTFDTMYGCYF